MKKPLTVACPTCATPVEWRTANPYRPFSCERCKLIDHRAGAPEEHKIPGDLLEDELFSGELDGLRH